MDEFLVGILAIVLGFAVCFAGLRVFLVTLPIWGFIAGFFTGAAITHALLGDGFLSTLSSWLIGLAFGLLFSVFAYFYWYVGVLIAAASTGGLLGSGFASAIGIDSDWLVFIFAFIGGVLVAGLAMAIALPVYLVIGNTAFLGAVAIVTGAMLIFNQIELGELGNGAAWTMIQESWFWVLAWVVLAGLGIGAQLRWVNSVQLPAERWKRAEFETVRPAI